MPASNRKPENIDANEEIRRQCRISTALWFELFGAIKPKVGALLKFPDLQCNYLQALESEVVEFCLLNQRPCRIIKLKPRQKGFPHIIRILERTKKDT
jgi:hypothetical protein